MEIIKTKDIKNLQFQDLYDFFYSLPSHGFRDFSKDIKTFENEFINLLEDPKYGFLFEYKNNKIVNYFLIKNEDSLKRSIIMTYDYNKIKDHISEIKEFTQSNSLEIGIRNLQKKYVKEISLFSHIRSYNFMKLNRNKLFNKIYKENFISEEVEHEQNYSELVKIQNECFLDQYGYEENNLSDFKSEIHNLEKRKIKSFFEISKVRNNIWSGYTWTQLNLNNFEGKLSMCGVKKEFRNKGIAKPLIVSSINRLINSNCKSISLEVDNENIPAKKIYDDLGFRTYSKLDWFNVKY